MMQSITSANTSINTLNKVYTMLPDMFDQHSIIFDYGCGKYNTNRDYCLQSGFQWIGYDPYNRPAEDNNTAMITAEMFKPATVVCSNVLNVIAEDEIITGIIADIARISNTALITIYEGNKSGSGKVTSKGYQRNQRTADYIPALKQYFSSVRRIDSNILMCCN